VTLRGNAEEAPVVTVTADASITVPEGANISTIVISGEGAKVDLNISGSVEQVVIQAKAEVSVGGDTDSTVKVQNNAEGAKITTEVKTEVSLNANAEIALENGAEGSSVQTTNSEVKPDVSNNTQEQVTVTDSTGAESTIDAGKTIEDSNPVASGGANNDSSNNSGNDSNSGSDSSSNSGSDSSSGSGSSGGAGGSSAGGSGAGGTTGGSGSTSYTVTFNSDGGTAVAIQTVADGGKATRPTDPTRSNYTFLGWKAQGASALYNFDSAVTSNLTLVAQWTTGTQVAYVKIGSADPTYCVDWAAVITALGSVSDNATVEIKLLADVAMGEASDLELTKAGMYTLDLNGKTLNLNGKTSNYGGRIRVGKNDYLDESGDTVSDWKSVSLTIADSSGTEKGEIVRTETAGEEGKKRIGRAIRVYYNSHLTFQDGVTVDAGYAVQVLGDERESEHSTKISNAGNTSVTVNKATLKGVEIAVALFGGCTANINTGAYITSSWNSSQSTWSSNPHMESAVCSNGNHVNKDYNCGSIINVSGGTIDGGDNAGIYMPGDGEVNITGGTVKGIVGVEIKAGAMVVSNNATISGATGTPEAPYDNGAATAKYCSVAVVDQGGGYTGDVSVTINGGTLAQGVAVIKQTESESTGKTYTVKLAASLIDSDLFKKIPDSYYQYKLNDKLIAVSTKNDLANTGGTLQEQEMVVEETTSVGAPDAEGVSVASGQRIGSAAPSR
jgi:uncharacterized repeat protein (TIGR02543 family)